MQKSELRKHLLKLRKAIPKSRREEASHLLLNKLQNRGKIVSFTPIGSEIDLTLLNQNLKEKNLLILVPYKIDSLIVVDLTDVDCILIPALGFDRNLYRIGYGKGVFDRFLATTGDIHTIGVGFKEQLLNDPLPKDPWDIPVKELILT